MNNENEDQTPMEEKYGKDNQNLNSNLIPLPNSPTYHGPLLNPNKVMNKRKEDKQGCTSVKLLV